MQGRFETKGIKKVSEIMIVKGDVVLKCPKTGKEVRLYQDCMKAGDPYNTCEHYKHWGLEGHRIVIACTFGQEPPAGVSTGSLRSRE